MMCTPLGPRLKARLGTLPLLLAGLAFFLTLPVSAAEDAKDARRELSEITTQLNALDAWMGDAERRQLKWQRDLKTLDERVGAANRQVKTLEAQLGELRDELGALDREREQLDALRRAEARRITDHLASAYRLSGEDFFKLLLNQESPEQFERMMRYHRYLSQARAETLAQYQETLAALDANLARASAREQTLASQQIKLDQRRAEVGRQRGDRDALLTGLRSEITGRTAERKRLTANQARLEGLLTALAKRATRLDGATFASSRGALPWPVVGPIAQRFGSARGGGRLKWQGVFIQADDGAEVRAIHSGRVAFADWLRGFGLLIIVDHGGNFMTLYAHTDVLYKRVGDQVEGGEPIAAAGRSGGQPESGLYFEIRADGRPRDPLGWLARRQ